MPTNPVYPFKCHITRCGWCGVEVGQFPFLTRRVRNNIQDGEIYELIECEKHHRISDNLNSRLEDWKATERAKFEQVLSEQIPVITDAFKRELLGEAPPEVAGEAPKPRGRPPKRPAGAIPLPEPTQAS